MVDLNSKDMSRKTPDKVTVFSNGAIKKNELSPKKKFSIKTPKKVELRVKSHRAEKDHVGEKKSQHSMSPEGKEPVNIISKEVPVKKTMKDFFSESLKKTKKCSVLVFEKIKEFYHYLKPKCIEFFHVMYPKIKSFLIQLWEITKKASQKIWSLLCQGAKKLYAMLKDGIHKIKSRGSK